MTAGAPGGTLALYGPEAGGIAGKVELDSDWTLCPLEEEGVLPRAMRPVLEAADILVLLDPLSFPFESIPATARSLPVFVVDGSWHEAAGLLSVPLFSGFTPYDGLVIADDKRWNTLRRSYRLMDHQRLAVDTSDPTEVLSAIVQHLAQGPLAGQTEELPSGAPLVTGPALRVEAADPGWGRRLKGWHLVQADALVAYLNRVADLQPPSRSIAMLEVGAGVGRLLPALPSGLERFHGYDVDEDHARALARSFPAQQFPGFHFGVLESHLRLPVEPDRFDVAICATEIGRNPDHLVARFVQEMLRAVRPGGRLIFVGDFVLRRRDDGTGGRVGIRHFCDVAERAAGRRLFLDHVQAFRYPDEEVHRGALLAFSALKASRRW